MKNKALYQNTTIYFIFYVLRAIIVFVIIPYLTKNLTLEEYGIYDYFTVLVSIITIIVCFEITQGVGRYVPEYLSKKGVLKEYSSTSLWFSIFCNIIFFFTIIIFKNFISDLLFSSLKYSNLITVVAMYSVMNSFVNLILNQLKWETRALKSVIVNTVYILSSSLLTIYFLEVLKLGLNAPFIANIIGSVMAITLGIYFTRGSYGFSFNFKYLVKMLRFSLPLVFSGIFVFIATYFDRVAIKKLMSLSDLGVYSVSYRVSYIIMLVIQGFQSSLLPLVMSSHNEDKTKGDIANVFRVFVFLTLFIFSFLNVFNEKLILLLSTKEYIVKEPLISLLVLSIFFSQMYIFFPGLAIKKKTMLFALINILSAGLNICLNFVLIPIYGVFGASLATLFSSLIAFTLNYYLSQRYYKIPLERVKILIIFLMVLFLNTTYTLLDTNMFFDFIFLIVIILIMLVCKLIYVKEVVSFFSSMSNNKLKL